MSEPKEKTEAEKAATRKKAEDNLRAATVQLTLKHGFLASAVLRKEVRVREDIPTIGTDGLNHLFYNPDFIAARSVAECIGLLAHEAFHDMGMHPFRQGLRDTERWAIACDAVVNQIVKECALTLHEGSVPPVQDVTPELMYEKIELPPTPCSGGAGCDGDCGGDHEEQPQRGKGRPTHKRGCGCHMQKPQGEDGKELTGARLAAAEADARLNAAVAKELASRTAGNMPAGLVRLLGMALEEKVPWQQIVSRFVTDSSKAETAWKKPNRRFLHQGVVLPSLWTPEVPDFVLACDTSGSIDQSTLQRVGSEVMHALSTCEAKGAPELTVVWCDTEVSVQVISDPKELEPRGGGGTMFSPVFEWVNENKAQTKGVVYVTDGYCSDFGPEPEYPVLWVLTMDNPGFTPPFGEIACVMD